MARWQQGWLAFLRKDLEGFARNAFWAWVARGADSDLGSKGEAVGV